MSVLTYSQRTYTVDRFMDSDQPWRMDALILCAAEHGSGKTVSHLSVDAMNRRQLLAINGRPC